MNKTTTTAIAIVAVLIIGGGAFYGGMVYGKSQIPQRGQGGNFGARMTRQGGNNFVTGIVLSKDDKSITVELPNKSGSKIVFYSGSTQVGKFVSGSIDDVAVGANVMVAGSQGSDGTLSAQSIQIRPAGMQQGPGPRQDQPK